jgi:hypothetical protein
MWPQAGLSDATEEELLQAFETLLSDYKGTTESNGLG